MGLGDMDKRYLIPFNGEMKSAKAWGLELGLSSGQVRYRHWGGLPLDTPRLTPVQRRHWGKLITHNGKTRTVKEWARETPRQRRVAS